MQQQVLTDMYAKITGKGWNLYESGSDASLQDVIPKGPTRNLEPGKQYVLLPAVRDPTSVQHVLNGIAYMQSNDVWPIIAHEGIPVSISLIEVNNAGVVAIGNTEKGEALPIAISHEEFNADLAYSRFTLYLLRRSELPTTVIELEAIAIAANMGFRRMPVKGYKMPAATGISATL